MKRSAEENIQGPNTRNKAQRPVYNPETNPGKETKATKSKAKPKSRNAQRKEDAIDVEQSDVTCDELTSGGHIAFTDVNNSAAGKHNQLAMNEWLINEAPKHKGDFTFNTLPTTAAAMPNDSMLEAQVQNVLINTASHLAKGNVPSGLYPHKYVLRGPEQKRMGLNTLTAIEYMGGIFKMDPAVP